MQQDSKPRKARDPIWRLGVLYLCGAWLAACGWCAGSPGFGEKCQDDTDCPSGYRCLEATCQLVSVTDAASSDRAAATDASAIDRGAADGAPTPDAIAGDRQISDVVLADGAVADRVSFELMWFDAVAADAPVAADNGIVSTDGSMIPDSGPENQPPVQVAFDAPAVACVPIALPELAQDPEGRPVDYLIVTQPRLGTLQWRAGVGCYQYHPFYSATEAVDSFEFRACDGIDWSEPFTMTIRIVPPPNCAVIANGCTGVLSDVYVLDLDGPNEEAALQRVYCDMTSAQGGWALAIKAKTGTQDLVYSSPMWTDNSTLNQSSLDESMVDAKLEAAFLPFDEMLISIVGGPTRTFMRLGIGAASLPALFNAPTAVTDYGRERWQELVPGLSITSNCPLEGTNLQTVNGSYRLGFVDFCNECSALCSVVAVGAENASTVLSNATSVVDDRFAFIGLRNNDFYAFPAASSCAAHKAAGRRIDGRYAVDPDGPQGPLPQQHVYCDMGTDGGGYMLVGRSVKGGTSSTFGWMSNTGSVDGLDNPYSLATVPAGFTISQMLIGDRAAGYLWRQHVFLMALPRYFVTEYCARAYQVDNATDVFGDCLASPTRLGYLGYTEKTSLFFLSDQAWFSECCGLAPGGLLLSSDNQCAIDGNLGNSHQGMIFVR
ncbi:MAG: hypothetical protein JXR83_16710 [Deltaproteobacteria bacterium]|nr:hypothetical protein [Deltaproteobacteria bacterium]